jgi:integrase
MKLTTTSIKTLTLPEGVSERTFFCDTLPAFGLRLRAGGSRSFVIQYDIGGKTKRVTLGSTATLDLGKAREKAKDLLAAVRLGQDPAAAKLEARARASETFGALLLSRYLPYKRAQVRLRSFRELERHLTKYARSLHPRPITAIDRRAIAALVATITVEAGPTAANCALDSLSGYFTWLLREGLLEGQANPASLVNRAPKSGGRNRVLTFAELREIWDVLGDDDYGDIVKLLVYTAARKSEIGDLTRDELKLDQGEIHLAASRVKNNRPHVIVLSQAALAILRKRAQARDESRHFVFGRSRSFRGWSLHKRKLDQAIAAARKAAGITEPMPGFVLHDFRRFFSTVAQERLSVPPQICEATLGHVGGFRSGVAGTYNKALYLDERLRALERWADFVNATVSGKKPSGTIVQFRG